MAKATTKKKTKRTKKTSKPAAKTQAAAVMDVPDEEAESVEAPDTELIEKDSAKTIDEETHANHVEANNSAMRRKCSPYRRKTNTYAKSETGLQRVLNLYWVIHNFVRVHFTTKEVPAVSLGVIESGLTAEKLFSAQLI